MVPVPGRGEREIHRVSWTGEALKPKLGKTGMLPIVMVWAWAALPEIQASARTAAAAPKTGAWESS
jgi:hypothetical protein